MNSRSRMVWTITQRGSHANLCVAHFCYHSLGQTVRAVFFGFGQQKLTYSSSETLKTVRSMFTGRSRPTWINLEPLSYSAVSSLVSKTLHRSKDDAATLSRFIYAASSGNAFAARNLLSTFQRQHHVSRILHRTRIRSADCNPRSLSTGSVIIGSKGLFLFLSFCVIDIYCVGDNKVQHACYRDQSGCSQDGVRPERSHIPHLSLTGAA